MKNVLHKNNWNQGSVQAHVDPPLIHLIKSKNNEKLDKDQVKIKFPRDLTSAKTDLNKFKMALFGNGNQQEFLLFIRNFHGKSK